MRALKTGGRLVRERRRSDRVLEIHHFVSCLDLNFIRFRIQVPHIGQRHQAFACLSARVFILASTCVYRHFLKDGGIRIVSTAHFLRDCPNLFFEIGDLLFLIRYFLDPLALDLLLFLAHLELQLINSVKLCLHLLHLLTLRLVLARDSLMIAP